MFKYCTNNKKGFTLIELLIVVSIFSSLAFFSFPVYSRFYKNTYSKSDLLKIENLLKSTRQKSFSSLNNSSFGMFLNKIEKKIIFYQGNNFAERDSTKDFEIVYESILISPNENVDINFLKGQGLPSREEIFLFKNSRGDITSLVVNKFAGIFLE